MLITFTVAAAAILALLRVTSDLSWLVVGVAFIAIVGLSLWAPTVANRQSRADFGTALATGAVISGMFFALTERDQQNQNRIAQRQQHLERQIAARQQAQQNALAQRQSLELELIVNRDLSGIDLGGAQLSGTDFSEKNLSGSRLAGAQLTGARFLLTDLVGADLDRATLAGAFMRRTLLNGAFLPGADLRGADLDEAYLDDTNIGVFDESPSISPRFLHRADLYDTALHDAHLRGACLAGADLRKAKLGGADLAGADLDGADLTGAKLIFAGLPVNLEGASVAGAKIDPADRPYVKGTTSLTPALMRTLGRAAQLPADVRTGHVVTAYDGQTADISPIGWVRLIGVTVPNLDYPYGNTARQFFLDAVGPSRVVKYALGPYPRENKPGNTGRWLIYAWNSRGEFINGALLEQGLAVRRYEAEGNRYVPMMNAAETYAKTTGKRIWTLCPEFPP